MTEANGKLTVGDLGGKIFVIPFYQRGYRWTENEATKLFNDLLEFAESGETEYCLQPIVLQKIDPKDIGKYENFPEHDGCEILRVVDGQQRLTTIAILLSVLEITQNQKWKIYYISEKKTLSQLLPDAQDNQNNQSINDQFRKKVKTAFEDCIKKRCEDDKNKIKGLLEQTLGKSVSFLRYDIGADESDQEGHDAFLRLNDGKTPLTSSELIRALYMVNAGGLLLQERMEISKEWEMIENTLRDEQFWLMFNSEGLSNTPTRIDLLFALVIGVSLKDAKANPRIVFEELDRHTADWDLTKVWHAVLHCFWWMRSCYADVELFNYLCWISEFTDNSAKTIYDKWRDYPKPEDFKKSIAAIIQKKYEGKELKNFTYDCDKLELRQLFVLLNILDCNHSKERFRFDLYKNESWDIEHIDSQTLNGLTDDKSKKEWLRSSYSELKNELVDNEAFKGFDEKNVSLDNFEQQSKAIIELLARLPDDEKIDDENALGNLALLSATINRSYKNAIFPVKRKVIRKFMVSGEYYVPPCTAKAFMKFYTESPSIITYWLKTDSEGYFGQMKAYFKDLLQISTELPPKGFIQNDFHKNDVNAISGNHAEKSQSDGSIERFSGAVSFSEFMNQYHVIIPKIQRSYVQGRLDSNGKKCLSSFASHLVDCVVNKKACPLDFIYGIDNKSDFYPLDGQQRLTTLLLLAWLCGANGNWSLRYESRRAPECFIDGLLAHTPPALQKPGDYDENIKKASKGYLPLCSDAIKKSGWFLSAWEEDAGIAGMLEMLDSLYCKLLAFEKPEFDFSKITFFVNYLDASKDSYDQIFLKMNSRGKPLTAWENVKAILDKNAPTNTRAQWQEKINNTWQEELWKKLKDSEDKISRLDSKMLSVVELALACAEYQEKVMDNTFGLAQWLEKKPENSFYEICSIFFSALENQPESEEIKSIETALTPAWENDYQWPDFAEDENMQENFYRPLLAYYAAKQSTDSDWMRVVWNIIENAEISKSSFPSAFSLIQELSGYADKILGHLSGKSEIKSKFAGEQVAEERAKVKQIPIDGWKEKITEAEKYAFFKGAIRFLFTNENGEVDWTQFETKFSNAKKYFNAGGVSEEYKDEAKLLRRLLTHMVSWGQWWQLSYDSEKDNWHNILLNVELKCPVHHLLYNNDVLEFNFACYKNKYSLEGKQEDKQVVLTEFLIQKQVLAKLPSGWKLAWRPDWDGGKGVYDLDPQTRGSHPYFIIHPRINLLADKEIKIEGECSPADGYIPGLNIRFVYKESKFEWYIQRNDQQCDVYLLDKDDDYAKRPRQGDSDQFYCFNVDCFCIQKFKDQLNGLVSAKEKNDAARGRG